MKVKEATRKGIVVIAPDRTIAEAAAAMDSAAVGALVVCEGGVPIGIVTDRDIVVRAVSRNVPSSARIDSVMTTDLEVVEADAELESAYATLRNRAIRRLPVVDQGRVVGMLTTDDLLMDLTAGLSDLTRAITAQVIFGGPEPVLPATV